MSIVRSNSGAISAAFDMSAISNVTPELCTDGKSNLEPEKGEELDEDGLFKSRAG
jgi:hypothetical protein